MSVEIRRATCADCSATRQIVLAAFHDNEPEETVAFLDALRSDGCILGEWIAEGVTGLLAHIVFSRVWIVLESGERRDAVMLTPLAVHPDRQRQGLGSRLMQTAMAELERDGEDLFLVLGHPAYYPRVGFSAERANDIQSPWSNEPAFMARCDTTVIGRLILPEPIADAH